MLLTFSLVSLNVSFSQDCNSCDPSEVINANSFPSLSSWIGPTKPLLDPNDPLISTTPQKVCISGRLFININDEYRFAPGSEIIFLTETSGITVLNGNSLVLSNTTVRGCTTMWESIEARDGSTLKVLEGSVVRDGLTAISLGLGSSSEFRSSEFVSNRFGIFYNPDNTFGAGSQTIIDNCGFSGIGPLLNDTPSGLVGVAATDFDISIPISNSEFMDFINPGGPTEVGVQLLSTDGEIVNSSFSRIGTLDNSTSQDAVAIFAQSNGTPSAPNLTVLECDFFEVEIGVLSDGVNLEARRCAMENITSGVLADGLRINGVATIAQSCIVTNSVFSFARSVGVEVQDVEDITAVEVAENEFDSNSGVDFCAINIYNNTLSSGKVEVRENTISTFSGLAVKRRGVNIENISEPFCIGNVISNSSGNSIFFQGINISKCISPIVRQNTTESSDIQNLPLLDFGIRILDSPNGIFECNSVDNSTAGVVVRANCDNTNFHNNTINNHSVGLEMDPTGALLGAQYGARNFWYSLHIPGTLEGRLNGNSWSANKHYIKAPSNDIPSNPKWANPRDVIPWFEAREVSEIWACQKPPGGNDQLRSFSFIDKMLLTGIFSDKHGVSQKDAEFFLLQRMDKYPQLLQGHENASELKEELLASSVGDIYKLYQMITKLGEYPEELEGEITNLNSELKNLRELYRQSLMDFSNSNLDESIIVLNEMQRLQTTIIEANDELDALNHLYLVARSNNISEALNFAKEVSPENKWEEDMLFVLTSIIQEKKMGETSNLEKLRKIAQGCRVEDGYAVSLARGFFGDENFYEYDLSCAPSSSEERGEDIASLELKTSELLLFPNPNNGQFCLETALDGEMSIFNQYGSLVFKNKITKKNCLDDLSLPTGNYRLLIKSSSDGKVIQQSFQVIR